jgi:hypothetical protein
MKHLLFLLISVVLFAQTLYFANENPYPLDPDTLSEKEYEEIRDYKFMVINIEPDGKVWGYYELYPYAAPYTVYLIKGEYDKKSGEMKVVANGRLHRYFYYKKGKLFVEEPDSLDAIDEVSAEEFAKRYMRAIKALENYEPAKRMRSLKIALELGYDPYLGDIVIYPLGLKKVQKIDPSAGTLGFLKRVLQAAGLKKGEATPQKIMQKLPGFKPQDFNNTGSLTSFIDGLILLENYLERVRLDPFKPEHLEDIENELFKRTHKE